MNNTFSITGSTVNVLEVEGNAVLTQSITNITQQPSLEEMLKLLAEIKAKLPELPEEVRAKVQGNVAETERQVTKAQPDKVKALDSLKNAGAILAEMPKTAAAAVSMGKLLSKAAIYCANLFGM